MKERKTGGKKSGLGRGLSALLEDSNVPEPIHHELRSPALHEIRIDQIDANPFQPRTRFDEEALKELADSIRVHGIIQPITVRKIGKDRFQLISGERRLQASKLAGLTDVPAFTRTADDQQMLEMALIENIQREDLNALEIALSYQRLISECSLKQEELGDRVGKNRSTVTNYLRLLKLPPDIQAALRDQQIQMGHARALINIENIDVQLTVFKKVLQQDMSVRQVEAFVRDVMTRKEKGTPEKKKKEEESYEIRQLKSRLSSHFGTKVELSADKKNKGNIRIPFVSADDLNRILEILGL